MILDSAWDSFFSRVGEDDAGTGDAVRLEEDAGVACVFTGKGGQLPEGPHGAQRDVLEVPDGCCDDDELCHGPPISARR